MNQGEKTSKLRCPSTGYCWRDGRRKCYYGVEVAVFCHSRDPLDKTTVPSAKLPPLGAEVCRATHRSVNADVNGAVNVWNVAVNRFPRVLSTDEMGTSGSGVLADPLLYRWNYAKWQ
jgi:hypothetical protein